MKENYETCLVGDNCVLVPYRPCHVEQYHTWMQNAALLEATGSEPLSLEQEYEMQQTWRRDPHKCTFIVLDKRRCNFQGVPIATTTITPMDQTNVPNSSPESVRTPALNDETIDFIQSNINAMVGDVNLFLSEEEDSDVEQVEDTVADPKDPGPGHGRRMQAEVDIMVAEPGARGRGIGKEATCLMIQYATVVMNIRRFFAKINATNTASRALFQQSLKFTECDFAECFQQYEYELRRRPPLPPRSGAENLDPPEAQAEHSMDTIDECLGGKELVSFQCTAEPQD